MAGDVTVAVVSGQVSTVSNGTVNLTKSGFGTAKAAIVILTGDTSDDTSVAGESTASIGFSDLNTEDFCIGHQDEDNSAKVDCDAIKRKNKCYSTLQINGAEDIVGEASTVTDGVKLTNTANASGTAAFATVIMFGGADLAIDLRSTGIASSQNGTANITHAGLTDGNDKLIFFIGTDVSGEDSASSGINNSFGVCHISGNDAGGYTFVQRCMGWASDHNSNNAVVSGVMRNDRCLKTLTEAGGDDWGLEVTAFSSSGGTITITTRDTGAGANMEVYSLIVDLDDRKGKIFSVDSPTSGATWVVTGLGFKPQYVGLSINNLTAENTIRVNGFEPGPLGISSNTGSGEETCHSWYNDAAAATTNTNNLFRSRVIDLRNDDVSTIIQDHSHLSFDTDGFTTTINAENETVARKFFGWAIEEVTVAAPTGVGAQTLPSFAQAGVGETPFEGAGAQALSSLIQAGVGVMLPEGAGAQTLASLTQAGVAVQIFIGTGAQILASLIQSGVGEQPHEGTGAQTLASLTQAGVGVQIFIGTGDQLLASLTQAGVGLLVPSGAGDQDLPSLIQAGIGEVPVEGSGAQILAALTQAGVGEAPFEGAGAQVLAAIVQAGVAVMLPEGTGAQILAALTQAGVGVSGEPEGAGVQDLPALTQAGVGVMLADGAGAQILAALIQSAIGEMPADGAGAQTLAAIIQSAIGAVAAVDDENPFLNLDANPVGAHRQQHPLHDY